MTTGENLKIDPFEILDSHLEIGWTLQEWIDNLKEETSYFQITENKDKVGVFSKFMVDRKSRN